VETYDVGVHTLVTRYEFGETGHEATLLESEYRCERAREENTLDRGECHRTLAKACMLVRNPTESPVSLTLDARDRLNGIKQVVSLSH